MAERHQRAGTSGAPERTPRADGWRTRAERAHGTLSPRASLTLSASELGTYAFCPQAWFLQRCELPVTPEMEARRQVGSQAHRQIGRQTDLVRATGALQIMVLAAIGVILDLLAVAVLRGLP